MKASGFTLGGRLAADVIYLSERAICCNVSKSVSAYELAKAGTNYCISFSHYLRICGNTEGI
jgi:hypothetical protein